jgi:hypothetical protein
MANHAKPFTLDYDSPDVNRTINGPPALDRREVRQ